MNVNILGTIYIIETRKTDDDALLNDSLGYTDESNKRIVITELTDDNCELADKDSFKKHLIRHEIIHAFLFESGMGYLMIHEKLGHDEQMIDWFARQSGKIFKAFQEAGVMI